MNIPRHGFERVCWSKPLRMEQTDAAVWHEVCRLLAQPERLEQAYRQRLHPDQPSAAYHGLETQMSKLRRGLARLIDSYADGLIDKQEFEPRVTHMRARLQHLEAQMQQLKAEGEMAEELRLIVGRLETFAAQVHDGLQQADFQTRREIIRSLVKRVDVDQQHIRVVFRVSPTSVLPSTDNTPNNWQDSGRRVLEARLQSARRHLYRVFGECGPRQERARTEARQSGCPLVSQTDALWPVASEFHPAQGATRLAGSHPLSDEARARARP
jgi:site-specific DNA recombinase